MLGNDFQPHIAECNGKCGECGKPHKKGATVLASIRKGKVKKHVCSEECRQAFDGGFYQRVADGIERRDFRSDGVELYGVRGRQR